MSAFSEDRDRALLFALSQRPERIGVARLCQELLADYLDEPITAPTPTPEAIKPFRPLPSHRGNRHNPWGRKGKPVEHVA